VLNLETDMKYLKNLDFAEKAESKSYVRCNGVTNIGALLKTSAEQEWKILYKF